MKLLVHYLLTLVLVQAVVVNGTYAADTPSPQPSAENARAMKWVRAEIRKIDAENSKVTLRHEPLTELNMGAMTMVFRVDDATMLRGFAMGDRVKFVPESRAGQLFVNFMEKDN
jgi:Cu(I)/Ag(I) efflux system protein CusF